MDQMEMFSLPPGFRFHPTDEELVAYYLRRKVTGRKIDGNAISDVDLYKVEPWDLPQMSRLQNRDLEWYFFSPRDRKYPTGSRTNRATELGYWKTTGKDRSVYSGSRNTGMKKTLVFYKGRAPHAERTDWVIHEYRLSDEECEKLRARQDEFVLCRLFKKSGPGPKIGEQYGAPLEDEEWEQFSTIEPGGAHNLMTESTDLPQGNSDMQVQDGSRQRNISPQQVPNETAQFESDTLRKTDNCLVNKVPAILNGPGTESSPENLMLPLPNMPERDWLTSIHEMPDGWDIEHILPLNVLSDAMVSGELEEDIIDEMYQLVVGEGGNMDDEHDVVNSVSDSFATCNELLIPERPPDGDFIELDDLKLPMTRSCDLNEQSLLVNETNIQHQPGNHSVFDGSAFDSDACGIQCSPGLEDALGVYFGDDFASLSFASNIETNMQLGDFLQASSGFANSEQNQELTVYCNNPNQVSSQGGAEPLAVSMQAASKYDDVVDFFEYFNTGKNTGDLSSFPLLSEDCQGENRIENFELNNDVSRNVNNFEGGQELDMVFQGSTIVEQASQFNTGTQEFTAVASFEGSEKALKRLGSKLLTILGSVPTLPASAAEISPRVGTISVMTSNVNVSAGGPHVCSCTKVKEEPCRRCSILKGETHETSVQSLTYSSQKHVVETPDTGTFAMAFLIAIWACFWLLLGGATWKVFRGIFRLVIS